MKPSIERELEAIRQMVRDLEARLKNESVQLGHRAVFDVNKRGEVPAPTVADRLAGKVLGTEGWTTVSGSGGGLSTVYTDGLTTSGDGSSGSPISANLLSGTINARFINLSGTIDAHFNALGGGSALTGVAHDATLSGDGTGGNPLSATPLSGTLNARFVNLSGTVDGHFNALSGTVNSAFAAMFSGSQVWSQTANGTEGSTLSAVLPMPYPNTSYYAFITNTSGTTSPVYRVQNKTSASFQVVSTAPFVAGNRIDFLAITGGLGPVWDGSVIANLSGTIDARFINLSGTISSAIAGPQTQRFSGVAFYDTNSTTILHNTATVITGTVEIFDTDAYHDNATNTSRMVAPFTGYYQVNACGQFGGNTSGLRSIEIRKNAAGSAAGGTGLGLERFNPQSNAATSAIVMMSRVVFLTAGDYIECFALQNSGVTIGFGTTVAQTIQMNFIGY